MSRFHRLLVSLFVVVAGGTFATGCAPSPPAQPATVDAGVVGDTPDGGGCLGRGDNDLDGVSNESEGCLLSPPRDTDGDGTPDFEDLDSDGDGVYDSDEDRNGDGMLGTCDLPCTTLVDCPSGYACSTPPGICVSFECMDGETNPLSADTDKDGVLDKDEGTSVCNQRREVDVGGLKRFETVDSVTAFGGDGPDWQIALEVDALHGPVDIAFPTYQESAYVFDLSDPDRRVAGFLVSRDATMEETGAWFASVSAVGTIDQTDGVESVALRSSGTLRVSLDGDDTVVSTQAVVTMSGPLTAPQARDRMLVALTNRADAEVSVPPAGWTGASTPTFMITYQTLYRADTRQIVFMGAVTTLENFDDRLRGTGFAAADLANGTALTHSGNGVTTECDPFLVDKEIKADIFWVVDESVSMRENRADVATHAAAFFDKARLAGLDFRMGVTDMNDETGGRFATNWTGPDDLFQFQYDISDPSGGWPADPVHEHGLVQGQAALADRLPRSDDPYTVRPDVTLVVIYIGDEAANSVWDAGLGGWGSAGPDPVQRAAIASHAQPYIDQIAAEGGIAHGIVSPEPMPGCGDSGVGWGYIDVVSALGGQVGSVCQSELGPTLDAMIEDIIGVASPIVLEWIPISLTLEVTRNGERIQRSKTLGWDYRASSNSIVFNGMPFEPGNPAEIIVSYRRWADQVVVQ